jgi:hypothetical protein
MATTKIVLQDKTITGVWHGNYPFRKKASQQTPDDTNSEEVIEEKLFSLCGDYVSRGRPSIRVPPYTCCARLANGSIYYWIQNDPCG